MKEEDTDQKNNNKKQQKLCSWKQENTDDKTDDS